MRGALCHVRAGDGRKPSHLRCVVVEPPTMAGANRSYSGSSTLFQLLDRQEWFPSMKRKIHVLLAKAMLAFAAAYDGQQSIQAQAPGGPGANADWLPANKTGFGTSYTTASNVWFTLQGGRLSEVYYPRLDIPSVRNLDFVITDGQSFAQRAQDAPTSTRLVSPHLGQRKNGDDPESLTYQIVNTDASNRWQLTTTYVTDPSRPTLLINVEFTSLNGQAYQVYATYKPQ